jgi:integrase
VIIGRRNCGVPCGRQSVAGTLQPATYSTLFGLIAATGLRISEALHPQCVDVDLANGTLTVRKTKFSKSRLADVSLSARSGHSKCLIFLVSRCGFHQNVGTDIWLFLRCL